MAFQIKRKSPAGADVITKDKYEDAIRAGRKLIDENIAKARTTITNLKTGETMSEAEIEEAALSITPQKQKAVTA
jgi:hypothetical protein